MNGRHILGLFAASFFGVLCGLFPGTGVAQTVDYCTQTAESLLDACKAGVEDDSDVGEAICMNIVGATARRACLADLDDAENDGDTLCRDQYDTRLDACQLFGKGRYDPDFSPARFDNPKHPSKPNRYFPLNVGRHWEYRSETQVDHVEVMNETKLIAGVTCIVVRDQVFEDGLHEATDDWYAAAKDGSVWYFGEEVRDFETFPGDKPRRPQLVSIDGSFKVGENGDKPGIIALASPQVGNVYFEEYSLANAEDVTEILSTTYSYGHDMLLDEHVPKELVDRFCAGNCVVTKNYSLLEPGIFARKYYARGVGPILEIENTGDVIQLVACNFDSRCTNLPTP